MLSTSTLNSIENELIIGLAGGLGVNFDEIAKALEKALKDAGYHVVIVRISENFTPHDDDSGFANCYWKMQYGTKQRQINGNDYWARKAVEKIFFLRPELSSEHTKIAYLVRSLKNKEELQLLSRVYGRNFVSIAIFSDTDASIKFLEKNFKLHNTTVAEAQAAMHLINSELGLGSDLDIQNTSEAYSETNNILAKFLMRKDQEETHPALHNVGQNLFQCYSRANFFIYQNQNLSQQIERFIHIIFNDPFAEPTYEEYFMFCAQAAAYRSLDLDRQVGAVIVNNDNELVAVGFNDVSKVGGGHFAHHNHPMNDSSNHSEDYRDFKQQYDYNHNYLDQIAKRIAQKLHLATKEHNLLREEISGITEFKRSTHAEMSALLDAARRGISIRDCTIYVNTYPCHTCTKHIIAAGISKVVFLYPYTKSRAREMFKNMVKHALMMEEKTPKDAVVFEPFLGVSPNYFMLTFANDKETRIERKDGKETGKPIKWQITKDTSIRSLAHRQPYTYISREWVIVHNKLPDITVFYKPGFMG